MSKAPLPLQEAKHVTRVASAAFSVQARSHVLEALQKTDPPGTAGLLSVTEFIQYLSNTTLASAWQWANQIDYLLHTMAREGLLMEIATTQSRSLTLSRTYLQASGLTAGQSSGDLWMMPVLGVPLLIDAVQDSLIHLTGRNDKGDVTGGTGLVLSSRHVLTAKHVVNDMTLDPSVEVPQSGGKTAEVPVARIDSHKRHDLALITMDDSAASLIPPRGIVTREPRWSDGLALLGYPPIPMSATAEVSVQTGEVVNPTVATYDGAHLFLYSAIARPGDSGGPIFARDGRLVGMVTQELTRKGSGASPAPFYAGLPARILHECLEDLGAADLLASENWE